MVFLEELTCQFVEELVEVGEKYYGSSFKVYGAIQRSWFAQVNALHNLYCKELQKVAGAISGPISE